MAKRFENTLASNFHQESTDAHNVFSAMIAEDRAISNNAFLLVTGKSDAHLMNGAEEMRPILKHLQSQFDMLMYENSKLKSLIRSCIEQQGTRGKNKVEVTTVLY